MTLEEMKDQKEKLGYTNETIAALSGISRSTVQKIFAGATRHPRKGTLGALESVFSETEQAYEYGQEIYRESKTEYTADASGKKQQGDYTLEDYYAVPEDQRVELIDGVFYEMEAPTSIHQIIQNKLCNRLDSYIENKGGSCFAIASPLDVQLDQDEKTMLQPDVVVVCDRNKITRPCIYGAPDLVIEILSKSTRRKDMFLKNKKYAFSGVREYWLIDPDWKQITVYDYQTEAPPAVYSFEDKIPVRIFDDDCRIDFKEIYEFIKFLYDK